MSDVVTTQTWPTGPGDVSRRGTTLTCDLDPTSGALLRKFVRQLLDGQTGVVVEDAMLVADELAANACRHGRAPRVGRLPLLDHRRVLLIEVDDAGPGQPQIRKPDNTGGRGLILVDRLTTHGGCAPAAGAKPCGRRWRWTATVATTHTWPRRRTGPGTQSAERPQAAR
ncbi:ATP-binding protein [Actinophytocola sp. KF-1]